MKLQVCSSGQIVIHRERSVASSQLLQTVKILDTLRSRPAESIFHEYLQSTRIYISLEVLEGVGASGMRVALDSETLTVGFDFGLQDKVIVTVSRHYLFQVFSHMY